MHGAILSAYVCEEGLQHVQGGLQVGVKVCVSGWGGGVYAVLVLDC